MPSDPRTIRGPCFDCDDALDDAWECCPCRRHGLRSTCKTAPTPKIEPEDLRPNVPPRMIDVMTPNWTSERPTEPGEYWLSLHPSERRRGASKTAWPYQTKIEMGTSELVLTIPSDDGGWFFIALSDSKFLRNAKWSHRETPADPFEEG